MAALPADKMAPEFTLQTLEGDAFSLTEALKNGPVLLAFFKVSCPVCQYAFPVLERLHRGYRGKRVTVIGISQNPSQPTAQFRERYGISFPLALDNPADYRVSNAYGLTTVPTVFLVAPSGTIEISSAGWSRADFAQINAYLAEAAQAAPVPLFPAGEAVAESKAG